MTPSAKSAQTQGAGQNHDRADGHGQPGAPGVPPSDQVEITAVQKMLSATSGSLLTGLLVFFTNNTSEVCVVGTRPHHPTSSSAITCAIEQTQQRTFTSTFDGLRKIARHEGVTTLWRGLSPTLVMAVPANIIYFTGYEWLRFNPSSPITHSIRDEYAPLVAGSAARILAATSVSPIELFRTRLQAAQGAVHGTRLVADTFRGIVDMVHAHGDNHADTFTDSFIAGACSGGFASVVTMPFDVGKTRTQVFRDATTTSTSAAAAAAPPEERNMARLLWHIFRTEGIPGLFRGWIPRTLRL
ncbi:Carrier protein, mitochondrial [Collariella sp. IMI 366227]|nr:Carrier protein, mitochondrial [Collariella sp. IMI 366227]